MLAKVFKSGNSMAIRIPKGVNVEHIKAFEIQKLGDNILLKPAGQGDSLQSFLRRQHNFVGK